MAVEGLDFLDQNVMAGSLAQEHQELADGVVDQLVLRVLLEFRRGGGSVFGQARRDSRATCGLCAMIEGRLGQEGGHRS